MYRDIVLALSPIAYWMLAEASGAVAVCEVDSAQDATYYGSVALNQPALVTGYSSAYFTGGDHPVDHSSCDIYSTTLRDKFSFDRGSVSGWFKWDGAYEGVEHSLLAIAASTWADGHVDITIDGDGLYGLVRPTHAGWFDILPTPVGTGIHQVAMTWSPDGGVAYLDGAEVDTDTYTGGAAGEVMYSEACSLGSEWHEEDSFDPYKGWLAHWALWDRVLTPGEVSNLYDARMAYLAGAIGASLCRIGAPADEIDEHVYNLFNLVRDAYRSYPA